MGDHGVHCGPLVLRSSNDGLHPDGDPIKERDLPQFYRETYRRYLEGIPTVPIVLIERQSGLGPRASALQSPEPIPTIEYPGR